MKHITILLLCQISLFANSQSIKYQSINIIESNAKTSEAKIDTTRYIIRRIDTLQFKNLLQSNKKILIQFWQPWCGGVKDWIGNLFKLYDYAQKNEMTFLFISDSKYEENYFINSEKKIGILTKYYNDFDIKIESYIITKGFDLETFEDILSKYLGKRINKDYFGYCIENKKLVYQNSSYKFYNHFLNGK